MILPLTKTKKIGFSNSTNQRRGDNVTSDEREREKERENGVRSVRPNANGKGKGVNDEEIDDED